MLQLIGKLIKIIKYEGEVNECISSRYWWNIYIDVYDRLQWTSIYILKKLTLKQ